MNVLLQRNPDDPRGVVAKIADFGLAIHIGNTETHKSGLFGGTLTHMAPEVLTAGRHSNATDM
jgi:serine/threonine protein kinase